MPIPRASDATPPAALIASPRPVSRMVLPISPRPLAPALTRVPRMYNLELELFQVENLYHRRRLCPQKLLSKQSVLRCHDVALVAAAQKASQAEIHRLARVGRPRHRPLKRLLVPPPVHQTV
jgi:hypothetical protein